jgi:hypothetical protein
MVEPQTVASLSRPRRRTGKNSLDGDALTAQGIEMRSANKTKSDNGGAKRVHKNTSKESSLDTQSHLN